MPRPVSLLAHIQQAIGLAPNRRLQFSSAVWVLPSTGWSKRLTLEEMQRMGSICPPRRISRNEVIYRKGDAADCFFILLEGYVKISLPTAKGEKVLSVLGPDDMFGESFLTLAQRRHSEAVCLSSTALICPINRQQFLEVSEKIPGVMLVFATMLAERTCRLEEELSLAAQPTEVRLARVLLSLAEQFGFKSAAGWVELRLELTQEELGSWAGTTRVHTTHILSMWRRLGLIEGTRGYYRIQVERLHQRMEQLE